MFEQFFSSMQQDVQLCLFFPFLCAVFRAIFIALYNPYKNLAGRWKVVMNCFRYGFWWGMDFNAYAFWLPLILISLPGVWIASYGAIGDEVRLAAGMVYATVLYAAFMGKVIFYTHFHDTYNHILRLGMKAEKRNLVDTFFHQDHGLCGGFWVSCHFGLYRMKLLWGYWLFLIYRIRRFRQRRRNMDSIQSLS